MSDRAAGTSRIRIRVGQVEVEYEGTHDFLKEDLPNLLASVISLREQVSEPDGNNVDEHLAKKPSAQPKKTTGTVAALAAKLSAKTGTDLILAAAAKLTLVDEQETFSRDNLLKAMKTASGYYKKSYGSNLSNYLKTLLDANRLTESSADNYAVTAPEIELLRNRLA